MATYRTTFFLNLQSRLGPTREGILFEGVGLNAHFKESTCDDVQKEVLLSWIVLTCVLFLYNLMHDANQLQNDPDEVFVLNDYPMVMKLGLDAIDQEILVPHAELALVLSGEEVQQIFHIGNQLSIDKGILEEARRHLRSLLVLLLREEGS